MFKSRDFEGHVRISSSWSLKFLIEAYEVWIPMLFCWKKIFCSLKQVSWIVFIHGNTLSLNWLMYAAEFWQPLISESKYSSFEQITANNMTISTELSSFYFEEFFLSLGYDQNISLSGSSKQNFSLLKNVLLRYSG